MQRHAGTDHFANIERCLLGKLRQFLKPCRSGLRTAHHGFQRHLIILKIRRTTHELLIEQIRATRRANRQLGTQPRHRPRRIPRAPGHITQRAGQQPSTTDIRKPLRRLANRQHLGRNATKPRLQRRQGLRCAVNRLDQDG